MCKLGRSTHSFNKQRMHLPNNGRCIRIPTRIVSIDFGTKLLLSGMNGTLFETALSAGNIMEETLDDFQVNKYVRQHTPSINSPQRRYECLQN